MVDALRGYFYVNAPFMAFDETRNGATTDSTYIFLVSYDTSCSTHFQEGEVSSSFLVRAHRQWRRLFRVVTTELSRWP
jgi:hypothetical protein